MFPLTFGRPDGRRGMDRQFLRGQIGLMQQQQQTQPQLSVEIDTHISQVKGLLETRILRIPAPFEVSH